MNFLRQRKSHNHIPACQTNSNGELLANLIFSQYNICEVTNYGNKRYHSETQNEKRTFAG